jgi:hypothetical protein
VHHVDPSTIGPPPHEAVVIHGERDDIVPMAASERLVETFPWVRLLRVDDEHGLGASIGLIVREVAAMRQRIVGLRA